LAGRGPEVPESNRRTPAQPLLHANLAPGVRIIPPCSTARISREALRALPAGDTAQKMDDEHCAAEDDNGEVEGVHRVWWDRI